jgi:hypothetical protein
LLLRLVLVFADSRAHAGLQLVDFVVRKAILEPDDETIYAAYLQRDPREPAHGTESQALRLVRYDSGRDATDEECYRPLL